MARHVITTTKTSPLEGSHGEPRETVTDGWYIDLDPQLSCSEHPTGAKRGIRMGYISPGPAGDGKLPREKPEFNQRRNDESSNSF
jgi:hypothetical protein